MIIPYNSYDDYVRSLKALRNALELDLSQKNVLRAEAHLPLLDVEKELDQSYPVKSAERFWYVKEYYTGFEAFREDFLESMPLNKIDPNDTWQNRRLMTINNGVRESDIKSAWHLLKTGEVKSTGFGDWIVKL